MDTDWRPFISILSAPSRGGCVVVAHVIIVSAPVKRIRFLIQTWSSPFCGGVVAHVIIVSAPALVQRNGFWIQTWSSLRVPPLDLRGLGLGLDNLQMISGTSHI